MTLKEFANVDSLYRDLSTGEPVPWRDYMGRIIQKLNIYQLKRLLPFSIEVIEAKLEEDENLNNTPLKEWDRAAECLGPLLINNGITTFSVAERVCILKETARMICEERKANHEYDL